MKFSVTFIERNCGDSPSIERVFRRIAIELEKCGIEVKFQKLPFGDGIVNIGKNIFFFKPEPSDVFHVTGHVNYIALFLDKRRTVLTLHDLTVLSFRSGLRRWLLKRMYFLWPVRRLKFLTSISGPTRAEITKLARIPAENILVIENPLVIDKEEADARFNKESPLILQMGTAPNKNVARVARAVKKIGCRLWLIGRMDPILSKELDKIGYPYRIDEFLSDQQMLAAYREADIVTYCSTNEGFGLPIIEAQAMGKPVVTSSLEPMSYVAGGAAVLVDPFLEDSIFDGIMSVIKNDQLREELIQRGYENISRFSPVEVAAKYIELYEEIVKYNGLTAAKVKLGTNANVHADK